MPQDKDLKRIVRQRMSETGERYTTARAAIEGQPIAGGSGETPEHLVPPRNDEEPRSSERDSFGQLLELAVHGIRAEDVRRYREVLPGIALDDIEELWIMGVKPEAAKRYADLGLTGEQMAEAAVAGLTVEEIAEFAKLAREDDGD